ncbi:copper fist DNA binding domain-containing protein [Aspergillus alliaceus]|uniref:Copper fist DNA binding domain-containing protein n=1 Tax=Petromyces alliaceus TaxID=209559 RepID=A0A5N7BYE8_PETAA|nr:copper fist DNA binding domain-containing protein [Aspergillus alliaceus]
MLIDGEKWACEACVRGHRVTTCKHHDRPLIRINRKGRPFSTCSVCNNTPCPTPEEHSKLKREAEAKSSSKRGAARVSSRSPTVLVPIAPRPSQSPPAGSQSQGRAEPSTPGMLPQQRQQPREFVLGSSGCEQQAAFGGLPFTCASFGGPALCSMVDIPGSMAMVSPLEADPTGRLLFGDGGFVDGGFTLEDLDVGALEREVMQEDWSWLSEEAL